MGHSTISWDALDGARQFRVNRTGKSMTPTQFRAYQDELNQTHNATAEALCISEVSVKRYATGAQPIPPHVAKLFRAVVLLTRLRKIPKLDELA